MKTNNHKLIVKVVASLLLVAMITTFTHCVPQNSVSGSGGGDYHSGSTIPSAQGPKTEGQIINEIQVTTGVKNHEQILHTMMAVTGIDAYTNSTILNVYKQVESSLPTDNDIKVFTSTQQVAVTKLAAEFCFFLTQANYSTQLATVWPGLNLTLVSDTAFNTVNENTFINNTINSFWGGVLNEEEYNMAHQELRLLIDDIINNENSSNATRRAVRGACTAALSSAYITLL